MGHIYYGSMQLSCYLVSASRRSLLFCTKGTSKGRDRRSSLKMKFPVILILIAVAAGEPGLLRVPKVYNAVITSNQNLSPSRAYPVIQPVIHRTAIGYVPPFYYAQAAPHVSGTQIVNLPQGALKGNSQRDVQSAEPSATFVEQSKPRDGKEDKGESEPEPEPVILGETGDMKGDANQRGSTKIKNPGREQEEPLSFYPNYQSLYYDPYFYTHAGYNAHLVPGTYYVDYQPYGTLEPIPASTPKNGLSGHLLPAYHEEKRIVATEQKESIPDVPPPPLPTAVPESS